MSGERPPPRDLVRLAHAWGVLTAFHDILGRRVHAGTDALLAVLSALGAGIVRPEDAGEALAARRAERARRRLAPVHVAWDGRLPSLELRLPEALAARPVALEIRFEDGSAHTASERFQRTGTLAADGQRLACGHLPLPEELPLGQHALTVRVGEEELVAHVLAAPSRARTTAVDGRRWGALAPTYALRRDGDWGCGDLTGLARLGEWLGERGASVVATLPLLASFLGRGPFEPSPYAPASRAAWNELFVDPEREPEWQAPAVQRLIERPEWRAEREELRRASLLDHRRLAALKLPVLSAMAEEAFTRESPRRRALEAFLEARPDVTDYARFRAATERFATGWPVWPERPRAGTLDEHVLDPHAFRLHAYGQWIAEGQVAAAARAARERGVGLVLDLPLGVHPDSWDTWRHQGTFAGGASVGAPPDDFFSAGQDWGFPPLHPEAQRRDGYRYLGQVLRHHLQHASVLRIDHVLGLHRVYWVPHGLPPTQGVYVRGHAEEQYAMLCLASHRHGATIVGEDLGTVGRGVRPAMGRHAIQRMHVLQFGLASGGRGPGPSPAASFAMLNTHDTPTFAAFVEGLDIDDFLELGLHDAASARHAHEVRAGLVADLRTWLENEGLLDAPEARGALARAALAHLAEGPAPLLLVNLEDLWLEPRPVNVPGTTGERPNWRRPLRHRLEHLVERRDVLETLADVDERRRAQGPLRRPPTGPAAVPAGEAVLVSEMDLSLFAGGRHVRLAQRLGGRPRVLDGRSGAAFALWAPDAASVSVFGDFDGWDPGRHPLLPVGHGLWQAFVPGARRGQLYKFRVVRRDGHLFDRPDPFARRSEAPPGTASRLWSHERDWRDDDWMAVRAPLPDEAPLAALSPGAEAVLAGAGLRELARRLDAARQQGARAVLLPACADLRAPAPDGDVVTGAIAPAPAAGSPRDLAHLVDEAHARGLAVLLPWPARSEPAPDWLLRAAPSSGASWPAPLVSLLLSAADAWVTAFHLDGLLLDGSALPALAGALVAPLGGAPHGPPDEHVRDVPSFTALLREEIVRRHPAVVVRVR